MSVLGTLGHKASLDYIKFFYTIFFSLLLSSFLFRFFFFLVLVSLLFLFSSKHCCVSACVSFVSPLPLYFGIRSASLHYCMCIYMCSTLPSMFCRNSHLYKKSKLNMNKHATRQVNKCMPCFQSI